jgi:hypothetical protein
MVAAVIFIYVSLGLISAFTNISKSGALSYGLAVLFFPFMILHALIMGTRTKKAEAAVILKALGVALLISSFFVALFKYII